MHRSPLPRRRSLRFVWLVAIATLLCSLVLPAGSRALLPAGTPAGYSVAGIDVSAYEGTVAWQAVKASGVSFAFIRASEQAGLADVRFPVSYGDAKAQGLLVGAYHRAKPDASSGKAQADYFLDHAEFSNDGGTLPPALDMEWPRSGWTSPTGRPLNSCYNMTPAQLVAWTRAFLAEVTARTGRAGVLYTSTSWWNLCTGSDTTFGQYPLWIARYSTSPLPLPAGWSSFAFWQYSSTAKLPNGHPIDRDVFNGDSATLASLAQSRKVAQTAWVDSRYQHVAYFSADGHVRELYFRLGRTAWAQNDLTAAVGAPAPLPGSALTSWLDSKYQHIAYMSTDRHVQELYFRLGGTAWAHKDLTASVGAPAPAAGSALTSWVDPKYQHIAYMSSDRHVHELYFRLGGTQWAHKDLTASVGRPDPAAGSALTSWVDAKYQHVAFISAVGDVRDLSYPLSGGTWTTTDLTTAAGAPAASPGSALTSWVAAKRDHVVYLAADGRARELYSAPGHGPWSQNPLTQSAGAPPAASSSALTSWVDRRYQHVVYQSGDGHVHELYFPLSGGSWKQRDLTAVIGAPAAAPTSTLTSWFDARYQHVVYIAPDGHAQELYLPQSGAAWAGNDITTAAGAPPASLGQ